MRIVLGILAILNAASALVNGVVGNWFVAVINIVAGAACITAIRELRS